MLPGAVDREVPVSVQNQSVSEAAQEGASEREAAFVTEPSVSRVTQTGDARIVGTVTTADGRGLSGARIRVVPFVDETKTVRTHVGFIDAMRHVQQSLQESRVVETNQDGRYAVDDLVPGRYRVFADAAAHVLEPLHAEFAFGVRTDATVDYLALPACIVDVEVRTLDGQPVASATVSIDRYGERVRDETCRGALRVLLPEGVYSLRAEVGGRISKGHEVVCRPGVPSRVTLMLGDVGGVRGRVLLSRGATEDWVRVFCLPVSPTSTATGRFEDAPHAVTARRDDGYAFEFLELAPGDYAVAARIGSGTPFGAKRVRVSNALEFVSIEAPRLERADFLEVRVLAAGQPVHDADVNLAMGMWVPPVGSGGRGILRVADGLYQVPRAGIPEEHAFLLVRSTRFGEKKVPIHPESEDLTVVLSEQATLLVDIPSLPAVDPNVRYRLAVIRKEGLAKLHWGRGWLHPHRAVEAGRTATLGPLEPGSYVLVLYTHEDASGLRFVSSQEVAVRTGKNTATLQAVALHRLQCTVREPVQELQLLAARADALWGPLEVRVVNGVALFERVPAGDYVLRGKGTGEAKEVPVRVPSAGAVAWP